METRARNKTRNAAGSGNLGSERGAVLLVVIILSAIALAVATSLLYMITTSTQISGMEKRFRTARDANFGAVEVLGQMIFSKQTTTGAVFLASLNPTYPIDALGCQGGTGASSATGLAAKILYDSSTWNASCKQTGVIDPKVANSYDFSFDIGTSPVYRIYVRIIDTLSGNTLGTYAGQEVGSHLDTHQGVVSTQAELPVENIPYTYLVETLASNLTNATERSRLQLFYQY